MLGQIGIPGIIILLVVCLIAFGSKNLPSVGRSLGESLREFKDGMKGLANGEHGHEKEQKSLPTEDTKKEVI
jgi:sec-independent protein translocase protein TatA